MGDATLGRRAAMAALGALGAGTLAGAALVQPGAKRSPSESPASALPAGLGWDDAKGEFTLPPLPYDPAALEPHIDAQTMTIHHGKHHAGYVTGLNKALGELAKIREGAGDAALVKHWSREVSFHGSGHVNHTLFWQMLAPAGKGGGGKPSGTLAAAIDRELGGFDKFATHFKAAANQVEGGGWAWLAVEPLGRRLVVIQEEKQQDMMLTGARPVIGIDVWEHAYYLKHQNRRADYVNAWFEVANWGVAQGLYTEATS